ncbi:LuxR C-terminal-related transcriptional regulator [Kitasatospora sp. NPDC059795]|uniref:helix-turn-helix transcriptional regulator n=1 Tax=Kitasatospora sp. NPDC059795 TaxID=3346949 RepID=UPI00365115A5
MTPAPSPELTDAQRRLIVLVANGASLKQIAAEPEIRLRPDGAHGAIGAVLAATGTHTLAHLAAWATAQRIVTRPTRPTEALTTTPTLTRRHQQVLSGWAGGMTDEKLAAELGIAQSTVRSYGKTVLATLGVRRTPQAVVVGVLTGLVLLSDINPAWPAKPLTAAVAL